MKFHSKSLVVLGTLVLLVIFLGGFRLGRLVEKADKSFVPPTPVPSPTTVPLFSPTPPPLKLETFTHPCGFSFDYPSTLSVKKQSSTSAELSQGNQFVTITCASLTASSSGAFVPPAAVTPMSDDETNQWELKNAKTHMHISFTVSPNLAALVLKTLRLTP